MFESFLLNEDGNGEFDLANHDKQTKIIIKNCKPDSYMLSRNVVDSIFA